jgi:hypothetical protein
MPWEHADISGYIPLGMQEIFPRAASPFCEPSIEYTP